MMTKIVPLASQAILKATENQVSCQVADDIVILKLNPGVYYSLNPVGTRIWDLLQEPITADEIRDRLLDEYDVDFARCEQEVSTLLEGLITEGLVEIHHDADS